LSDDLSGQLADFARACRAAIRAVSLYPATHSAIGAALDRTVAAAQRLALDRDVVLEVQPHALLIDRRLAERSDGAIAEVAALLHERLVGTFRIGRGIGTDDWRAFFLIASRSPDDLRAEGGISKVWERAGCSHLEIREIDYAEMLGGWTNQSLEIEPVISYLLRAESATPDQAVLSSLGEAITDPARFGALVERLQSSSALPNTPVSARAVALIRLIRTMRESGTSSSAGDVPMEAATRLSPEMLSALIERSQAAGAGSPEAQTVSDVVTRMSDATIARFVAGSIGAERGANQRLAQALGMIAPSVERRTEVLNLAKEEATRTPIGQDPGFEQLWQDAVELLVSYSDKDYVNTDYGRELSFASTRALEMERITDDPPARIDIWLSSLSNDAVRELDIELLLDLLQIERDPDKWAPVARAAVTEIERLVPLGQLQGAQRLLERITAQVAHDGAASLRREAESALQGLANGPLVNELAMRLRSDQEIALEPLSRLCRTVGRSIIHPLANALASEQDNRAIRGLCEILSRFGIMGREAFEQLKASQNPEVRRVAIELLRSLGGRDALSELTSMLDDADPRVQRESMRAIVRLGTSDAYTVLKRELLNGHRWRQTRLQQLVSIRDDRVIPLLCYVLDNTRPRGKLAAVHLEIMDTLGHLQAHPESIRRLRTALHRGEWWAPLRTARLRRAAAAALARVGTPDALAVLQDAATKGSSSVRMVARAQMAGDPAHGGSNS
jgi:HEAT repeat protein